MSGAVLAFACVLPAGTTSAAPTVVALPVGSVVPDRVRWRVPPGPRGHVSFYVAQSGVAVLPSGGGVVTADGEWDTWDVSQLAQSGAWSLVGWNTGTNSHTVYIQMEQGTSGLSAPPPETGDVTAGFPTSDAAFIQAFGTSGTG